MQLINLKLLQSPGSWLTVFVIFIIVLFGSMVLASHSHNFTPTGE